MQRPGHQPAWRCLVKAMRVDERLAHGAIRFSLSRYTTDEDERKNLGDALRQVRDYCDSLEQALVGVDDPEVSHD